MMQELYRRFDRCCADFSFLVFMKKRAHVLNRMNARFKPNVRRPENGLFQRGENNDLGSLGSLGSYGPSFQLSCLFIKAVILCK